MRELLAIAVLTPAQAALVAADLLEGAGTDPGARVHAVLTGDGTVAATEVGDGVPGVPLWDLVDEVVRNARRLPAHPRPHQLRLMHHLEEQVGRSADPAERASALREALAAVVGDDAVRRVRRELATLAEAFTGIAVSRSALANLRVNGHAVASAPIGRPILPPTPGHAPRRAGRRRARPRRLLVVLLALAVVLAGGYLLLRGPGSALLDAWGGGSDPSGQPRSTPSDAPGDQHASHPAPRHAGPYPALAAHAAGRVRGVVLQSASGCRQGAACGVTVTVHLAPAAASQVIGWRVGVAHRCTRHVAWSPETTVTAQPGWTRVFATSPVRVPQGRSLALFALTSTPRHAQSRPVPVAGTARRC